MQSNLLRLVFSFLALFIGQLGLAQTWDLRMITSSSLPSVIYDDPLKVDLLNRSVNDLTLSLLMDVDSLFSIGLSLGTLDYNTITIDQGNIALALIIEKRFFTSKRVDLGINVQLNATKSLSEEFINGVYSSIRMGYGLGANIRFKPTEVIGIILQYGIHNDYYTNRRNGADSFLGRRKIVSLGISYVFD